MSAPFASASPLAWGVRIAVAVMLAALLLWGGLQDEDPLAPFVRTDKMRHIVAFGAAGLFATLFFSRTPGRLAMIAVVLAFAVAFEIAQPIFSTRSMSLTDLAASIIGVFAGYGFGMFALTLVQIVRRVRRPSP